MLSELYIRNFAIIDELRLRFDVGFNVLTGETGAGKSIILDAMTLVLGDRADISMIRAGCPEAYVEATFQMNAAAQQTLLPLIEAEGLEGEPDDVIVLARELRSNGRNISRINGRTVSLALLRQIAEPLIDIHGQGEHLSLLRPHSHLPLLDSYAGLDQERAALAVEVSNLQRLRRELSSLRQDERALAQRVDMLQFQVQEIKAAGLQPDDEDNLREERDRLANAEHLMQYASEAVGHLSGLDEDDSATVLDKISQVERLLGQLVRYDSSQSSRLEEVQGLLFQLGEVASDLQDYLEELEFNPGRLNFVEERLELINGLKRKYGPDIAAILAWGEKAEAELDQISNSEERIARLESEQEIFLRRIGKMALALSLKRKQAGQKLASAVELQVADLKMDGTRLSVDFRHLPDPLGAFVENENGLHRFSFDQTGIDQVEFLLSTNPGEPLKPMAKVASGGETARIMLALKTALAEVDGAATLIFDEVDQGIGGRVGDVAGRKLWTLTAGAKHQVIVVTHLPQLAGYGDSHFNVSKRVNEGRTTTSVTALDSQGRIDELAAMLGTKGEHAIGGAEAILRQAAAVKRTLAG